MIKPNGLALLVGRKLANDDYDRPCDEMRYLPMVGEGNILVGKFSYYQVARERKAEGARCPPWESLRCVYVEGRWL